MDDSEANKLDTEKPPEAAKVRELEEAKRREESRKKKRTPVRTLYTTFGPFRIIAVLALIILFLLLLLWLFGLGSGGGKALPGSSNAPSTALKVQSDEKTASKDQPSIRRELQIAFVPSEFDAEVAQALTCNISWIDAATGSRETRLLSEDNMPDFEFALEKTVRTWYSVTPEPPTQDIPIIAVRMTPFPGEGTLQKITRIVHIVDPRISILRFEK